MKSKQKFYFLWIALIIILVFILQSLLPGITQTFSLSKEASTQPWRFLTAVFLHGSITHLAYNLFAIIIFGLILEQLIGSKRFLILYLTSGILANIISWFLYPNALGASGAIMAIIGTLAILRPLMAVWTFGMILPMFIVAILWITGSIMGIFGFGDQGTGHLAHLSGLIIGLIYGVYLKIKSKTQRNIVYMRKITIPDNYMRDWEETHMR